MPKMTETRRNEIAYLYVVERVRQKGIPNLKPNEVKREIGNTAKKLEISVEEANEFARNLVWSLVEKAFPEPKKEEKPLLGPAFENEETRKRHRERLVGDGPASDNLFFPSDEFGH